MPSTSLSAHHGLSLGYIRTALDLLNTSPSTFLSKHVAADVNWQVTTPATQPPGKTTPIAGIYTSRDSFSAGALGAIQHCLTSGLKLEVVDTIVETPPRGAKVTKSVVELHGNGTRLQNGQEWNNYYSWVLHWNHETNLVDLVRAYLDSAAVNVLLADEGCYKAFKRAALGDSDERN